MEEPTPHLTYELLVEAKTEDADRVVVNVGHRETGPDGGNNAGRYKKTKKRLLQNLAKKEQISHAN